MCVSSFKPIFELSSENLEYVIVKRGQLYTEQNILTLSSWVDLPRIVDIENLKATVTVSATFVGFFTEIVSLFYLMKLLEQNNFLMVYYFFTQGVCVAIIPCKKGSQYYLVHSHAQNT